MTLNRPVEQKLATEPLPQIASQPSVSPILAELVSRFNTRRTPPQLSSPFSIFEPTPLPLTAASLQKSTNLDLIATTTTYCQKAALADQLLIDLRSTKEPALRQALIGPIARAALLFLRPDTSSSDLDQADLLLIPLLRSFHRNLGKPAAPNNGEWALFQAIALLLYPPAPWNPQTKTLHQRVEELLTEAERNGCAVEDFQRAAATICATFQQIATERTIAQEGLPAICRLALEGREWEETRCQKGFNPFNLPTNLPQLLAHSPWREVLVLDLSIHTNSQETTIPAPTQEFLLQPEILAAMLHDPTPLVRSTMICSLRVIAKTGRPDLATKAQEILLSPLVLNLLHDSNSAVISTMHSTLQMLAEHGRPDLAAQAQQILQENPEPGL